ncbi:hypothetical protein [Parvibaculum sp.]|uniref:hypothetical protein n=1 Tax=Parvibaculum sp. TaxID=2024848 RepID=UPI002D8114C1|nr:hypothetical protein [Parvibaculum sp.]
MAASLYAGTALAFPVVSFVYQTSLYKPTTVQAAGFNVEMHGTPPGADAAAAVAGLHGPSWVGGAELRLLPADASPGKGTRLVLIFNGAGSPDEIACSKPDVLVGNTSGGGSFLRVLAIYCSGDRMITRGALSDGEVTGTGETYRDAMQSLLNAMFPPQNTNISPFGGGI